MPPETRRFAVTDAESGLTLLAALRKWLPGTSWSAARKLLAGRHVLVNDALCLDEARRMTSGEAVTLYQAAVASPPSARDVRLVWLDSDVIVVDKPAGMTTLRHAAERSWTRERKLRQPALDDLLPDLAARHEKSQAGREGHPPVHSVHRIDRDTSGLVVFARNTEAQRGLIRQFKAHTIERTYLAVAHGRVAAGRIESWLVDDRGDGKRGSAAASGEGKRAVTHVRPLEWLGGFTLIECRLETGRTHQIRIHLSEKGHPLYGDTKYGTAEAAEIATAFPRLALHAASLGFDHPASGRRLRFESPLPAIFLALLARLRQGALRERPNC